MGKFTADLVLEPDGLISCWDAPVHPFSLWHHTQLLQRQHAALGHPTVTAQAFCMALLAAASLNPWETPNKAFSPNFTEKPGEVVNGWVNESWRLILVPTKHLDTQLSATKR